MGFTRAELERFVGATVDDLVGPDLRLLFVGINPGLWTAATQTHFAYPGNRFYPALLRAGIIDREIDRGVGMSDADRRHLLDRGIGITNVAHRATAKASELSKDELRRRGRHAAGVRPSAPARRRRGRRDHGVPHRVRRTEGGDGRTSGRVRGQPVVDRAESERPQRPRNRRDARRGVRRARHAPPA